MKRLVVLSLLLSLSMAGCNKNETVAPSIDSTINTGSTEQVLQTEVPTEIIEDTEVTEIIGDTEVIENETQVITGESLSMKEMLALINQQKQDSYIQVEPDEPNTQQGSSVIPSGDGVEIEYTKPRDPSQVLWETNINNDKTPDSWKIDITQFEDKLLSEVVSGSTRIHLDDAGVYEYEDSYYIHCAYVRDIGNGEIAKLLKSQSKEVEYPIRIPTNVDGLHDYAGYLDDNYYIFIPEGEDDSYLYDEALIVLPGFIKLDKSAGSYVNGDEVTGIELHCNKIKIIYAMFSDELNIEHNDLDLVGGLELSKSRVDDVLSMPDISSLFTTESNGKFKEIDKDKYIGMAYSDATKFIEEDVIDVDEIRDLYIVDNEYFLVEFIITEEVTKEEAREMKGDMKYNGYQKRGDDITYYTYTLDDDVCLYIPHKDYTEGHIFLSYNYLATFDKESTEILRRYNDNYSPLKPGSNVNGNFLKIENITSSKILKDIPESSILERTLFIENFN